MTRSLADLHDAIGRKVADGAGVVHPAYEGGHTRKVAAEPLRGLQIDVQVRPVTTPPPADTPFIQTIRADWAETDRLMDEAWARFRKHGNGARYKAECAAIVERQP